MPKLGNQAKSNLYLAFTSFVFVHTSCDARSKKTHMKICNAALLRAGLPLMKELEQEFERQLFDQEVKALREGTLDAPD